MDRLTLFRQSLRRVVNDYRGYLPEHPEIDVVVICDDANGQYALMEVGWQYPHRIYRPVIHARIKDGKIWVEQDWTKHGIINDLLDAGVRPIEIEQGSISPMLRVGSELAPIR